MPQATRTDEVCMWLVALHLGMLNDIDKKKTAPEVCSIILNELAPRLGEHADKMDTYINEYHWGLSYVIADLAFLKAYEVINTHEVRLLLDMAMSSQYVCWGLPQILWESKVLDQASGDEVLVLVRKVISEQPRVVQDIKAGKEKAVGALVGVIMKQLKTDPAALKKMLLEEIKNADMV